MLLIQSVLLLIGAFIFQKVGALIVISVVLSILIPVFTANEKYLIYV